MSNRRKLGLEKIAEILTVTKQPCLKQHIKSKCSLSSHTFNKYLNLLLESGLLDAISTVGMKHLAGRKTKRRMTYQTSVKGKVFLKGYAELTKLLKSDKKNKQLTYTDFTFSEYFYT